MAKLLIIDDEPNLLYSLQKTLQSDDLEVLIADTASTGLKLLQENQPDVIILDVRLPDMSGLDAFNEIRSIDPRLPVIIITAHTTTETAIEATKRGAYEYLLKPVPFDQLRDLVSRAVVLYRMSHVPARFEDEEADASADTIVGRSPDMQDVYKAIGRAAPQDVTVLIQGESGTGKELVARAIFHHSRRNQQPFMAINCASIPDTLLESELFGHERGAFTGAERNRVGKFEQVDGGTLFLDEIGDMSHSTQAKVLRLLQDGCFQRVGGNETVHADVRIIAATNRDLNAMVESGDFRRDLFYRLKVFAINLPPLRSRIEDIPRLVDYFLKAANAKLEKSVQGISEEALQTLTQHDWPGNVRELQSAIEYSLIHCPGELITIDCLPPSCRAERATEDSSDTSRCEIEAGLNQLIERLAQRSCDDLHSRVHAEVDRVLLERVLQKVEGSQVKAAKLLGIARSTLRIRIEELGINIEKKVSSTRAHRRRDGQDVSG